MNRAERIAKLMTKPTEEMRRRDSEKLYAEITAQFQRGHITEQRKREVRALLDHQSS